MDESHRIAIYLACEFESICFVWPVHLDSSLLDLHIQLATKMLEVELYQLPFELGVVLFCYQIDFTIELSFIYSLRCAVVDLRDEMLLGFYYIGSKSKTNTLFYKVQYKRFINIQLLNKSYKMLSNKKCRVLLCKNINCVC